MFSRDDATRRETIRRHMHDTRCLLLTEHEPCLSVAAQQQSANPLRRGPSPSGRDILTISPDQLAGLTTPRSWMLVALLCRDDDIRPLVAWVRVAPKDRAERVRFYHHASTDPETLLRPWALAGLPYPSVDSFSTQRDLRARFGRDVNERIFVDHGANARRPSI